MMNSAPQSHTRLLMTRENLEAIPEFALPAEFALRWYRPGDEAHWLSIHRRADQYNPITPDTFAQQFGADFEQLGQRQAYLIGPDQEVIGTGAAWFDNNFGGTRIGRVHWVAIVPEYQGRGLSKPLMCAVCRRLHELGHGRAYLTTSAARARAIQLYLRFGFVPLIRDEAERASWRDVMEAVGLQARAKLPTPNPKSE